MKRTTILIASLALAFGLLFTGCGGEGEKTLRKSRVQMTAVPAGVPAYTGEIEVSIAGTRLPLFAVKVNTSQVWNASEYRRIDAPVGFFRLEGIARVTVRVAGELDYSSKVRPLSAGIVPVADPEAKTLTFEIRSAGNYAVEINGDRERALFLFVQGAEEEPEPETGTVLRFPAGLHTAENNPAIDRNNVVPLSGNTTVILEPGAVVRAKFSASNAEDITIRGSGIIDGSAFVRNASTGQVTVPLDFSDCKRVTLKDFAVLDPAGWCVNFYFIEDSAIENIKIMTSRSNGDGISLQSCKNISVRGAFVRSWDDSLVVKNYPRWEDRTRQGSTDNITFEDCTLWTDLAQSMEIGYETVGRQMEHITFRNITVLHNFHKPVMSIHNANNADVQHVLFENITVEDAQMGLGDAGSNSQLIECNVKFSRNWSTQHTTTELGSIDGVTFRNVTVKAGRRDLVIEISGSLDDRPGYGTVHTVENVRLENIWARGTRVDQDYPYLRLGSYVSGITAVAGTEEKGAEFRFSQSGQTLAAFGPETEVVLLSA